MKCPFCNHLENKVIDSRVSKEGDITRRRRECLSCEKRYTTYERIEEVLPMVIKKDGRREPFDRLKIKRGIEKACQKRSISVDRVDELLAEVERHFQEGTDREVKTITIGEYVMGKLKKIDEVAYVRFASVYREFKDVSEFVKELNLLKDNENMYNPLRNERTL
ncbi:MAG: transcriptional regulator NrdR [Deltaproteobacteria bacterium RIFCSPHIGHO2_02_FULL_40_11]|nr:MAG: transcriptional regulator NrdR [Deltaproteobacteria bacterium RIFCSPHIGHO2_02_FULL_40_11]